MSAYIVVGHECRAGLDDELDESGPHDLQKQGEYYCRCFESRGCMAYQASAFA